jgi:hypothetical protein
VNAFAICFANEQLPARSGGPGSGDKMHALIRTNPDGQPFAGTCVKCGKPGLPMKAVREPCKNFARLTESEALLEVLQQ